MTWQPLSARSGGWPEYEGPFDDVPSWLTKSLQDWVDSRVSSVYRGEKRYDYGLLLEIERRMRLNITGGTRGSYGTALNLVALAVHAPERFLDVIDFLLGQLDRDYYGRDEAVEELESILHQGGSVWKVVPNNGAFRLLRRVDETVTSAAGALISRGDRAGKHLAVAWNETYGRTPNASTAYREAVRAVEAAAKPIVSPNDSLATLGKMIGSIKASPQSYSVSLSPHKMDPVAGLLAMLEMLWTSQLDRHGTDDESVPLNVSDEDAETALHLAVTLVHWFTSGAVQRI